MIMINDHGYRDLERNDADGPAEGKQWIEVFETDAVRARRYDHSLKADVHQKNRSALSVDDRPPVAMRRHARDEQPFFAASECSAVNERDAVTSALPRQIAHELFAASNRYDLIRIPGFWA